MGTDRGNVGAVVLAAGKGTRMNSDLAKVLHPLGDFFLAPGYSTERMYVFLARDLYPAPLERDLDERIEVVKLTKSKAYRMVEEGKIFDAKTLAGMLLAIRDLGR